MGIHKVKMYYIPFNGSTAIPVTIKSLKIKPNLRSARLNDQDFSYLLQHLNNKIVAAKIDYDFLRLILVIDGRTEYHIDSDGRVKHRNSSYYISPGSFLWLYKFMEGRS